MTRDEVLLTADIIETTYSYMYLTIMCTVNAELLQLLMVVIIALHYN